MKGFVGIGRADHVETAITEATAGLKKADFLILIAPIWKLSGKTCNQDPSRESRRERTSQTFKIHQIS